MKWPLLDVQPGGLQSRQALKDARSPSPAHIVVSNTQLSTFVILLPSAFTTERNKSRHRSSPFLKYVPPPPLIIALTATIQHICLRFSFNHSHPRTQWALFISFLSFVWSNSCGKYTFCVWGMTERSGCCSCWLENHTPPFQTKVVIPSSALEWE